MTSSVLQLDRARAERSEIPPPTQPMLVAREMVERCFTDPGTGLPTLLHWRGGWHRWTGTHWQPTDDQDIRAEAFDFTASATSRNDKDELVDWSPNKRKVTDLLDALKAYTLVPNTIEQSGWIPPRDITWSAWSNSAVSAVSAVTLNSGSRASQSFIACADGLLDPRTRKVLAHTPAYFNSSAVPFSVGRPKMGMSADTADTAEWLRFLRGVWPEDPTAVDVLQEWFGYVLSGRTDLQKMLLLVGPPRSGKGTIARVLRQLVGDQHTAAPTLASLATNFGLQPLIGKPLAIVADARLGGPTTVTVERLLSITGEDHQNVDRKNREHWFGRLPCRFMLCSNELPRLNDASAAIASRFLPLIMRRGHLGAEDLGLADRLEPELPAILHWALDGLDRLTESGRFTQSADSGSVLDELRELSSPVSAFVRERCELGGGEIEMAELYRHWRSYAEDNGLPAGNAQTFGRNLVAAFPEIQRGRPGPRGTNRNRVYRGICLR